MEGRGQIPSQPSNYVSILHLRERWLKENERNQKENEEQKQREQQVQEQKVQLTEPEGKNDQKPEDVKLVVQEKPRIHSNFWSRNGNRKLPGYYRAVPTSNPRNVKETCKKTEDEGEPPPAVPQIEKNEKKNKSRKKKTEDEGEPPPAVPQIEKNEKKNKSRKKKTEDEGEPPPAVPQIEKNEKKKKSWKKKTEDEGEPPPAVPQIENNEKKKKSRKKKTEDEGEPPLAVPQIEKNEKKKKGCKKNRRAQNEEMDRTSETPAENLKEEMRETECEVVVQNGKKNVRARRIDEKKGMESQCGPETGYTHEMKEVENKLSRMSVSFEIKRGRNNGIYRGRSQGNRNFGDHWNLHRRAPREHRDVGMIWVRKDELPKAA